MLEVAALGCGGRHITLQLPFRSEHVRSKVVTSKQGRWRPACLLAVILWVDNVACLQEALNSSTALHVRPHDASFAAATAFLLCMLDVMLPSTLCV